MHKQLPRAIFIAVIIGAVYGYLHHYAPESFRPWLFMGMLWGSIEAIGKILQMDQDNEPQTVQGKDCDKGEERQGD